MKKFILQVCLILLPVIIFYMFPLFVIVSGREYYSGSEVVASQEKNNDARFLYAYNTEPHYAYKKALIEENKPKIIVFGTSRALQIRKEFFTQPENFVNAASSGTSIWDIEDHIKSLPKNDAPSLIILGLDREMFLQPPQLQTLDKPEPSWEKIFDLTTQNARLIYADYYHKKFSIHGLMSNQTKGIGVAAIVNKSGFRYDGSLDSGQLKDTATRRAWLQANFLSNLGDTDLYNYPMTEDQKNVISQNIAALEEILQLSKKKGIKVVAYLSPFPKIFYNTMSLGGGSNITPDNVSFDKYFVSDDFLQADLTKIFNEYDASIFNLTDINKIDASDNEFFDFAHGTDKLYLRAVIYMAKNSSILEPYIDSATLNEMLKNQQGDYLNF